MRVRWEQGVSLAESCRQQQRLQCLGKWPLQCKLTLQLFSWPCTFLYFYIFISRKKNKKVKGIYKRGSWEDPVHSCNIFKFKWITTASFSPLVTVWKNNTCASSAHKNNGMPPSWELCFLSKVPNFIFCLLKLILKIRAHIRWRMAHHHPQKSWGSRWEQVGIQAPMSRPLQRALAFYLPRKVPALS